MPFNSLRVLEKIINCSLSASGLATTCGSETAATAAKSIYYKADENPTIPLLLSKDLQKIVESGLNVRTQIVPEEDKLIVTITDPKTSNSKNRVDFEIQK